MAHPHPPRMPNRTGSRRRWPLPLSLAINLVLLVLLWSAKRRRHSRLRLDADGGPEALARSLAGLTQTTLCAGNRVELVQNGDFFRRLHDDLARAEHTIHLETFLAKEGEVTRRLAAALAAKARRGVKVRVMLDASGGRRFGEQPLRVMRRAGVDVRRYHALRPSTLGMVNNRDHRKIVVVDGRIGYIGGHCLVDSWLGEGGDKDHFRDLSARVEGPVVAQLQSAFAENWIEEAGEALAGDACFPALTAVGDSTAHVVWVTPAGGPSCVGLLHELAVRSARRSLTLQNPYFLPDPEDREALAAAVARGVRVRVMLPAAAASDAPLVQHASHHHYGTLLAAGVELYEYQRTLLHQKTLTVDGEWSIIGSANFDDRSFEINDEVALVVVDREVAGQLEEVFARDLRHARRVRLEEWRRRSWRHRLLDFTLYLANEQL